MDLEKLPSNPSQDTSIVLAPSATVNDHPTSSPHGVKSDTEPSAGIVGGLPPPPAADIPRRRRRWWLWLLALCLIALVAFILPPRPTQPDQPAGWKTRLTHLATAVSSQLPGTGQSPPQSAKPPDAPVSRGVPVVATAARQGDLKIYLTALGSVTAFNTVTVRTRVDGQLVRVAFQEGQTVHQGDLLAEIDPRPFQVQLSQAQGQLARNEALLKNAKVDLERYKNLLEQDSVSRQQLDTQMATVSQIEGSLKSDQAQIDNAKLQLTYSRITAPISGRIGLRLVDQGNMVHASDQNGLAVITQLQPIAVLFSIPADDLPQVLQKMQAGSQLATEAYNRDLRRKLATGTLLTIDNQIDQNTGTIRCKAVFPNEDNALFPNQFVNVQLLVDTKQNATIVPSAAIQRSPQSIFVYVVKSDNTVEVRNVAIGATQGDDVAIADGLSVGEVVVTEGVDRLQQGTRVAAREAGGGSARENQ